MWQLVHKPLQPGRIDRYHIVKADDSVMSYAQVIDHWASDTAFADFFSGLLASSAFEAFYWETPPVTRASAQRPFECVLIDSPSLAMASPDALSFAEYFRAASGQAVVDFENLGGDARLIVPCPVEPTTACTHLAGFMRAAPTAAKRQLWQAVAAAVSDALNEQPLWISTCGLGVYWLHVRLDSFPKYYRHAPYQRPLR